MCATDVSLRVCDKIQVSILKRVPLSHSDLSRWFHVYLISVACKHASVFCAFEAGVTLISTVCQS